MSIKTLRKRIALVAVSALGAGLMSVVAVPSANAANGLDGLSATGFCIGVDGGAYETSVADDQETIVLVKGGTLTVVADGDNTGVRLSAGGVAVITGGTGDISAGGNISTNEDNETTILTAIAAGTVTITSYLTTAPATAVTEYDLTVVDSCPTNVFDAAESYVHVNTANEDPAATATNVDDTLVFGDEDTAWILIKAENEYGSNLPAGTWLASATNGAVLDVVSGTNAAAGSLSQSVTVADGDDIRVAIAKPAALAGKPVTTTVTVTYGTQTIATRTLLFTGDLAKIEVSSVLVGATNDQNFGVFTTKTFDSAGNQISWPAASLSVSGIDYSNITAADADVTSATTGINGGNYFTCGATAKGTTKLKVKGATNAGTYVYSDEFNATCASTPRTWSVSMDKASYVPGDIATVTITAKDVNGAAVHDPFDASDSGADAAVPDVFSYVYGAAGTAPSVVGSNLTAVVAPAAGDYFVGGVKTYKFVVGSTEGSYQLAVSLAGITTDVSKTVPYSIKLSSATVTNAEVLAAIVKLIASINKQIKKLQALIKK